MRRIIDFLLSSKATIILLIILAIGMGTGTFIEDKYDTTTARELIYNAKWFEFLFLLLALNFIGHIKTFNMLRKQRLGGLIFHLSFIVMILGAGITRYYGYEGNMHIREGEDSNILYSSDPYLRISLGDKSASNTKDFRVNFGEFSANSFHTEISSSAKGNIDINCKGYIKNAEEKIVENSEGGVDLIELIVATGNGRERVFIQQGQTTRVENVSIAFNDSESKDAIKIMEINGLLQITSPFEMTQTAMDGLQSDTLLKDSTAEFKDKHVYNVNNLTFLFSKYYKKAVSKIVKSENKESESEALLFDISINGKKHEAPFLFSSGQVAEYNDFYFDGLPVKIAYGKKPVELPFSIHLNDFILERYAGSESPSSYASEVTVIDNTKNIKKDYRIFMNNILNYGGYRFFQSSYDRDEKGTILSVNHDFWGTSVSYAGYMLLTLGFLITLFNKDSRFLTLRRIIIEIRRVRKSSVIMLLIILGYTPLLFSQNVNTAVVNAAHADKFGHLINQSVDGRFEPVSSLAYDIFHKLTRKDKFSFEGKGEMNAEQACLDMMVHPEFWKEQKIIYVKEQSIKDILGISTKAASFNDFFDANSKYKLQKYAEDAFRKKPVEQNSFDKEIIKVDERINIFMMVLRGAMLKIFPEPGSPDHKWISWEEPGARIPLKGVVNIINQDLKLSTLNYANIMQAYMHSLIDAVNSGDYSRPDKILGYMASIQRQGTTTNLLPGEAKVNAEVFYNRAQIFIVVKNYYAMLSLILLLLAFIDNVKTKKNKIVSVLLNTGIVLLGIGFLYQTFGMILRWYLLGYAPWSNGYEALILVSWGTLLAGFTFVRYSKITLAATSLLAFFILMTASHSSYDPQLTSLTPVLKSYWLIIHVAVLTISYGFLGLGFILGIMNLFLYLFKTRKNHVRLDLLISELTFINEMNLTIGIVLATVGTFLGGVWANESWGRYWGWDAKETWALIIVISYTILLHLRLIPRLNGKYVFNVASVLSFGSVLMTFFGVNYFLSKGMHSYGAGEHAIFPLWAWCSIISIILLIVAAKINQERINKYLSMGEN